MTKANWRVIAYAGVGIVATSITADAQSAPSTAYTSFEAHPGTPVQIDYYAAANRNCTAGPRPTIRVVEAPKAGTLKVKLGEVTAAKVAGCPAFKMPAQLLSYEARAGSGDTDHFIYDVIGSNGQISTFQVTIDIKDPPKPVPAPNHDQKI